MSEMKQRKHDRVQPAPLALPIPALRCAFCGHVGPVNDEAGMLAHIAGCLRNPHLRGCLTCAAHYVTQYTGRRQSVDRCRLLASHKRVDPAKVRDCRAWGAL